MRDRQTPSVELNVTWTEFHALVCAREDGTGVALLDAAREFLTPTEVDELVRHHLAARDIRVVPHHEAPVRRLCVEDE